MRKKSERGRRFSAILTEIAADGSRDRISVADLVQVYGDRAFGALLLIFALPNVLPMPPGASGILGAPLVILSAQLMLGRRPWLPQFIMKRSMTRNDFGNLTTRAAPWLKRAERLLRPRLNVVVAPPGEYAIGAVCLLLSVILFLPIPLGNMLPAFAICILALAILGKDGLWAIVGLVLGFIATALVAAVLAAMATAAWFMMTNWLG